MSLLSTKAKRIDVEGLPKIHTEAEVESAVAGLTPADLKRLRAVAGAIFSSHGLDPEERDPDDLVAEAVARTLDRTRGWRKGVDFRHHLIQSMRSVGWTWKERQEDRARIGPTVSLAELKPAAAAVALRAHATDPESAAIARDLVRKIERAFAGDRAARAVLAGWASEHKGPEICRRYRLTEKELRAAVRRIRRFAVRLRDGDPGGSHGL